MKKFISIVAALSMVASLSVTSFAAINVSVSEKGSGKATLVKESNGTFTADLATGSNTSQDTIVVVKGDGSEISTTSIQYINQAAAAQNFNFVLKDEPTKEADFGGASSLTYTVLMGGDKVAKTEVGTITYAYTPDVTKYTIVFKAEDGTQISSTEYEEGATVTLPTDPTKADDETYTYTFAGWKVEGADDNTATKSITATANATYVPVFSATPKEEEVPFTFTVNSGLTGTTATKPYNITNGKIVRILNLTSTDVVTLTVGDTAYTAKYYTATDKSIVHIVALVTDQEITSSMIKVEKGTPVEIKFGDSDGNSRVNAVDVTAFRRKNAKYTLNGVQMALPTDIESLVVHDVDGNGRVNAVDITAFRRANAKYTLNGVQLTLPTMGAYTIK